MTSAIRIVGIAGGSCSGKTTLARAFYQLLGPDRCALLYQDSYYIDQSSRFKEDGGEVNFDHPSAIDFALMGEHLRRLKAGLNIEVPVYDFVTHKRMPHTIPLPARPVILVDGTLLLSQEVVRNALDDRIFIAAAEDVRFARRRNRDVAERGREPEGVVRQFLNHVKPMHDLFVEPSRAHASVLHSGESISDDIVRELMDRLCLFPVL
jgi:uridine kinase